MKDVGLQLETRYAGGATSSRFIESSTILNVIINEGLTLWQVRYYLAVLVRQPDMDTSLETSPSSSDGKELVVIFEVRFFIQGSDREIRECYM
jgi:hypothetical protein